jgi:hypothetical protein
MSFDEDEELEGFKIGEEDEDEPLDIPDMDFGLDEEDPDKDH